MRDRKWYAGTVYSPHTYFLSYLLLFLLCSCLSLLRSYLWLLYRISNTVIMLYNTRSYMRMRYYFRSWKFPHFLEFYLIYGRCFIRLFIRLALKSFVLVGWVISRLGSLWLVFLLPCTAWRPSLLSGLKMLSFPSSSFPFHSFLLPFKLRKAIYTYS